jgi:WD40 repeat protein
MFLMNERTTKQSLWLSLSAYLLCAMHGIAWAQKPELVVQTGHSFNASSIAISRDGTTLASSSSLDKTIRIWDVTSGTELRTFKGDSSGNSVAFSPDGKTLASGSVDKTIKLWDITSGKELLALKGHSDLAQSLAFSPDGKMLASGGNDKMIKLWDVTSGVELRTLIGHSDDVNSVAFSPDGKTLASGGQDETIKLWEVISGTELRTLKGHSYSVAFSPDGKALASGGGDTTIKLWDVTSGVELRTLKGHSDSVDSVAFSPDGQTLASSSDDTVKLWEVASGRELRTLKGHSVAFSPDGKTLVSSGSDKTIKLWDLTSGKELRTFKGYSSSVSSVAFSSDGKTLASGGTAKTIALWNVASRAEFRTLKGHFSYVSSVAFSPDGKTLASGGGDTTVKVWDVTSGGELRTLKGSPDPVNPVLSVAFSPDGKMLASGSYDKTINLWDLTSGAQLRALKGHSSSVSSVAFSPDGKMLASGSWDNTINLWDVTSGAELRTLKGHSSRVSSVAFSPNGKMLASGSWDNTIKLWDVTSGAELRTLKGHSELITSVTFSPDGKALASGGWNNAINLWDVTGGAELRALKEDSSLVNSVAFSPDGKTLVSASGDGYVKLWRLIDGTEVGSLVSLDENDWMVVTPDGLFDGSPGAWNKIIWRFNNNTFDHAPVEAFYNEFYFPGLLSDILAGRSPKAPSNIAEKDRRQPQLKLTRADSQANAAQTARNLTVNVDVAEVAADKDHKTGSGAQDVRLFRNGSLVKVWRGDVLKGRSYVSLEATVPIVAGANNFTAYAFNHDNIKSGDATLAINGAASLKRVGTAYILAIGINNYANSEYNLKYAVADAQDFSAEVKRQQEMLKHYDRVEVISLADGEATKANIIQKLAQLAAHVQPEDAVIIYFAGHGTAHGNEFYLIPHDLGYDGPRTKLNEKYLQTILAHSISDRELEKVFEGIDAGQLLLVIDACNSGQALEAEEKRRGPMNSKGLAQLAYEKGMYVLTAAQSYQAAQEAAKFGHGFLTYALVEEGLKQGIADREPKDGTINLREWLNYATDEVPKMQDENILDALRGRGRYLNFAGDGSGPRDAKNNVQRPRIFYRRELESNPLVIAVLGTTHPQ